MPIELFRRPKLFGFETLAIDAVTANLPADSAQRLRSQLERINKIQRLADGKEVNLYFMRGGKPVLDDELTFRHVGDETHLATVRLLETGRGTKLKAEVWLARGRLFSLLFGTAPKQFFADSSLEKARPEVFDVHVYFDPLRPASHRTAPPAPDSLTGWPAAWVADGRLTDLHAPLPPSVFAARLKALGTKLPADYVTFARQADGAVAGSWKVFGLAGIRPVVGRVDYLVLAEHPRYGVLAVVAGDRDGRLFFLPFENDGERTPARSFTQALSDFAPPPT